MADNNYRSDRSRDPFGTQAGSDPLAELARLIGQGDPYAETNSRNASGATRSSENTAPPAADWEAEENYPARAEEHYAPPPPRASYEDEAPTERYFSGPAANFNGFRQEDSHYQDQEEPPQPPLAARPLPAYAMAPPDDYEATEANPHGDEAYAADDYYDEAPSPRRRSGVVVVMAIFGLAVVGTAGAFGYRAMFGGSVLPTLPPIIKADNGPNKIVPSHGQSQADNPSQANAATTGATENLVSREEQPVTIEPPKPAPRVVSTIPIINGEGSLPPGMGASAPAAAVPANSPWPPPPPPIAAPQTQAATPVPVGPLPAQASAEPKKIHTVTIRADQSGGADAPPPTASAAAPAARTASRPAPAPKPAAASNPPPAGPNAPLSIVPGGQSNPAAPTPHSRVAAAPAVSAPMTVASAGPVTGVAAPASGGGYAVQVTSQRSEAEAKAAFRELRAKYPDQLNGREPIIRRADLGAKGTFYRALVGPFASAEEAAGVCGGIKAAGGNCIVQRN